jgi:hypothetical protein
MFKAKTIAQKITKRLRKRKQKEVLNMLTFNGLPCTGKLQKRKQKEARNYQPQENNGNGLVPFHHNFKPNKRQTPKQHG